MTQEKAGFGEQAINKIAEIALARQVGKVKLLKVQVKTDLSKLAHGEVDSIAININGLARPQGVSVEELQLQINRITVKPRSAMFGKIILTHPSDGTLRVVINEDDLTLALNSESFREHLHQIQGRVEDRVAIQVQQVKCRVQADGNIAFNSQLILGKTGEVQGLAFTATPRIGTDGQGIVLQDVHYLEGRERSPELTAALLAQASEVLSLRDFEKKGTSLRFVQIDVASGKLTMQAAVYIDQFPSS